MKFDVLTTEMDKFEKTRITIFFVLYNCDNMKSTPFMMNMRNLFEIFIIYTIYLLTMTLLKYCATVNGTIFMGRGSSEVRFC